MESYVLSITCTVISMISSWLYGNSDWRGALLGLVTCVIWVYYDIKFEQYALLIPTFVNTIIACRNLIKLQQKTTISS